MVEVPWPAEVGLDGGYAAGAAVGELGASGSAGGFGSVGEAVVV